jgi:UDP-3-O-[3-hydroxymyristoyl] N-acetylglucosamine deacetylase
MSVARCQRTLCRPVAVDGFGYFSGRDIRVEFRPARANAGIVFVRRDLGVTARVPVSPALRIDVPRRTTLEWRGIRVEMIEHVLAALAGLQIDNCEVWVNAPEMPGCDGSSQMFVEALDTAGTVEAAETVRQIRVAHAMRVGNDDNWIEARPSRGNRLSVSFDLDYSTHPAIGHQKFALDVNPDSFRAEVAPCRTFIPEEVAHAMVDQGLGLRVTSQNLLIFGPNGPIENTLRFPDECVRHKVLDVVGDLALTGCEVIADVVAYRSGHRLHAELAQQLLEHAGTKNRKVRAVARRVA